MFPFLIKNKQRKADSGVIIKQRQPNTEENQESTHDSHLEMCAQYLIYSIQNDDYKAATSALISIFEILKQEPTDSHVEPHSFEAQNIKE